MSALMISWSLTTLCTVAFLGMPVPQGVLRPLMGTALPGDASVGSVTDRRIGAIEGTRMNRQTRLANINRWEVLETGKSGANRPLIHSHDGQNFCDFAHRCV
jgi:hypothetical protein